MTRSLLFRTFAFFILIGPSHSFSQDTPKHADALANPSVFGARKSPTVYINNAFLPLTFHLPGSMRSGRSPSVDFFVQKHSGENITDVSEYVSAKETEKAFVFWAEQRDQFGGQAIVCGLEAYLILPDMTFEQTCGEITRGLRQDRPQGAEPFIEPVFHHSETWISGRRLRVFDIDGLYPFGGHHTRNYLLDAGTHVLCLKWAVRDPVHRATLNGTLRRCLSLGMLNHAATNDETREMERQLSTAIDTVEELEEFKRLEIEIHDAYLNSGDLKNAAADWLNLRPNSGGGVGDVSRRFGAVAGAKKAWEQSLGADTRAASLQDKLNRYFVRKLRNALPAEVRAKLREFRPDLEEAFGPSSQMARPKD